MALSSPWPRPDGRPLENDVVRLTVVTAVDREALFASARADVNGDLFRYHVNTPPMTETAFDAYLARRWAASNDVFYAVYSKRLQKLVGSASFLNVQPLHGTVEVGSIWYALEAQRTEINTNAMFLLFRHVFDDLGYRRLEWKCNNQNEASKAAALRLGLTYEGLFRQHLVSRGENRDTAWFSLLDREWPDAGRRLATLAARPFPS